MPGGSSPRTAAYFRGVHRTLQVFSNELYRQISAGANVFSDIAAFGGQNAYPTFANGSAHLAKADFVSGNFFRTLGVNTFLGRTIAPDDDKRGAPLVAVLTWRYWKSRFDLDPKAVGSAIRVNGREVEVIGVTPKGFEGVETGYPTDIYVTLSAASVVDNRGKTLEPPDAMWPG